MAQLHVGQSVGMRCASLVFFLCLLVTANMAHAARFRAIGAHPAILYNAPTERARKVYIAPSGMPVEVIIELNGWSKIRDASTDLSWVESSALTDARHVIVIVDNAVIRMAPAERAPEAGTAMQGVWFKLLEPAHAGWVKVQHIDGTRGYLKANDVWGD